MTGKGDLEQMPTLPPPLTCEQVDRDELDTRYLRGALDSKQAEAFEAHYFGCDRCWQLVDQGRQIRSARIAPAGSGRRLFWIAAAAAFAAVIGAGLWSELQRNPPEPIGTVRSGTATLAAPVASSVDNRLSLTWKAFPNAASYRVRLFDGDGTLVYQRELNDTSLAIAKDSLASVPQQLVWQVHALNPLGNEIGRFPLTTSRP